MSRNSLDQWKMLSFHPRDVLFQQHWSQGNHSARTWCFHYQQRWIHVNSIQYAEQDWKIKHSSSNLLWALPDNFQPKSCRIPESSPPWKTAKVCWLPRRESQILRRNKWCYYLNRSRCLERMVLVAISGLLTFKSSSSEFRPQPDSGPSHASQIHIPIRSSDCPERAGQWTTCCSQVDIKLHFLLSSWI